MNKILFIPLFFIFSCYNSFELSEREILKIKLEAFQFLSKYHHQLHIMIGEDEGDMNMAYQEFINGISRYDNVELIPVKNALLRIKEVTPESENIKRLDYLVDYYQSGLSMQIEAIMRGYGQLESFSFENSIDLYDRLNDK